MTKKRLVIIQERIPHYRRPIFNKLANKYCVKVIHSSPYKSNANDLFQTERVQLTKILGLRLQFGVLSVILRDLPYSVISTTNPRNLTNYFFMIFLIWKVKWVWWGLEKSKHKLVNLFYRFMIFSRSPVIFYNDELKCSFIDYNGSMPGYFVANNTVHIENSEDLSSAQKDIFLNVGSLHNRKKNIELICAFKAWHEKSENTKAKLILIGDGPEMENLKKHVFNLNLNEFVELTGAIEDPEILKEYYQRAFAAVSFGQAGPAVLQSFAFGVPYITSKDAISGGEKYNIFHEYNGMLIDQNIDSFASTFELLTNTEGLCSSLGSKAYRYYHEHASMERMAEGFCNAINFEVDRADG